MTLLENTDISLPKVHNENKCATEYCTLHNRSDHHMRAFPQHWRDDQLFMERICPHGIGHPDPDELKLHRGWLGAHGCDGCCQKPPANDPVNHPNHYTAYKGIEVIQLTEMLNFCRGNAVKYIARAGLKDPAKEIEDLKKARWYLDREITRLESSD